MPVTDRLVCLTGCVAIGAASCASALANANLHPAPAAFAPDVPNKLLNGRSQYGVSLDEQVSSVCIRMVMCVC